MSKKPDPYASEAETAALIKPEARTPAQKKLDKMLDERGAWEQGAEAYPILYQIAVELMSTTSMSSTCKDETVEVWRDDAPSKRGAYKVKRVGSASVQRGYSYWNGERWGMIFSRRSLAQEYKTSTRNRQSQYTMEWLQKGGAA